MFRMKKSLVLDIGNSTCFWAQVSSGVLGETGRCATALFVREALPALSTISYDSILVSSVVPALDTPVRSVFPNAIFASYQNVPGLSLNLKNPEEVGADRLVTALAGSAISTPCLVIDSGTAITFCYVDEHACYQGGAIVPGMGIASMALNNHTAKIPLIKVAEQPSLWGKNTKEAVEIGLYQGYLGLINGFIARYRNTVEGITVIGTGAGLDVFRDQLDLDVWDEDLILKGLLLWLQGNR